MVKISQDEASILTVVAQSTSLSSVTRESLLENVSKDAKEIGMYLIHDDQPPRPELRRTADHLREWVQPYNPK
jgi:hypothetical protein